MEHEINNNKDLLIGITAEKLKTFKGCENYTDEEAAIAVDTLNQLAIILLEMPLEKIYSIDNQLVISLREENKKVA